VRRRKKKESGDLSPPHGRRTQGGCKGKDGATHGVSRKNSRKREGGDLDKNLVPRRAGGEREGALCFPLMAGYSFYYDRGGVSVLSTRCGRNQKIIVSLLHFLGGEG